MKANSWLGFTGSLAFHSALAALLFFSFKPDDGISSQAEVVDTNISMQMMMATVIEQPPAQVEKKPVEIEPEKKEIVSDPTLKEKIEKPKEKEPEPIKKEKPKEKPKKETPKKQPVKKTETPKDAVKSDRNVDSPNQVNSQATGLNKGTNNPNLAGSGNSSSEISAYQSALRREIERNKKYSQRAKMMRKQGVVVVAFTLSPNGSISNARITKSSGTEDLDNSALYAVQNARSIGAPPAGMNLNVSVPIQFKIQ